MPIRPLPAALLALAAAVALSWALTGSEASQGASGALSPSQALLEAPEASLPPLSPSPAPSAREAVSALQARENAAEALSEPEDATLVLDLLQTSHLRAACEELLGVDAKEAFGVLSGCFRDQYPELTSRLELAPPGARLVDVFGEPADLEWPMEFDDLTREVFAWFDKPLNRKALDCPLVAMEARHFSETGSHYEGIEDELAYELPWWFEDKAEMDALVWGEYDWDNFTGTFLVTAALIEQRNRWEDRAFVAHPEAAAWVAVMRELCNDFETSGPSWMYTVYDLDPCPSDLSPF